MEPDTEVIINAQIEQTEIGFYNGFSMTCWLMLRWEGAGQGFGGYCFDRHGPNGANGERVGTAYGCEFIRRILRTLEAERWEDLKGMYLRVRKVSAYGDIIGIGHILNDKWFCPKADLAHLAKEGN